MDSETGTCPTASLRWIPNVSELSSCQCHPRWEIAGPQQWGEMSRKGMGTLQTFKKNLEELED